MSSLTHERLNELEQIAKAAHPWSVHNLDEFRSAFNPATVLALLSEVRALRSELSAVDRILRDGAPGPRDGLLLIDIATSLVNQRKHDDERCAVYQADYETQRQRASRAIQALRDIWGHYSAAETRAIATAALAALGELSLSSTAKEQA